MSRPSGLSTNNNILSTTTNDVFNVQRVNEGTNITVIRSSNLAQFGKLASQRTINGNSSFPLNDENTVDISPIVIPRKLSKEAKENIESLQQLDESTDDLTKNISLIRTSSKEKNEIIPEQVEKKLSAVEGATALRKESKSRFGRLVRLFGSNPDASEKLIEQQESTADDASTTVDSSDLIPSPSNANSPIIRKVSSINNNESTRNGWSLRKKTSTTPKKSEISGPTNVTHTAHGTFDTTKLKFNGVPESWTSAKHAFVQFGCSIKNVPRIEVTGYKEKIPVVLVKLKEELISHDGLLQEGVFRITASKEDQEKYKLQVDEGTFTGCTTKEDVMCMAALLKEWFRSMPVRLLNILPRNFIADAAISSVGKTGAEIMKTLAEPNNSVFCWLLDILCDCASNEAVNKMNPKAIAIVMAPNLYKCAEDTDMRNYVAEMEGACAALEKCIQWRIDQRKGPKFVPLF